MKKLISLMLIISLLFCSCMFAEAYKTKVPTDEEYEAMKNAPNKSKYKLYEDFSSVAEGGIPVSISNLSIPSGTSVGVVKGKNEQGKTKNLLKVSDENSSSNVSFYIPVNQASKKILFETKFKFVQTSDKYVSFLFDALTADNKIQIIRTGQWSNGGAIFAYSDAAGNMNLSGIPPVSDAWYTLQILFDKENGSATVQLKSNALVDLNSAVSGSFDKAKGISMVKNVTYNELYEKGPIPHIRFWTTSNRGEIYFDYISLLENAELEFEGDKPRPLDLPVIANPEITPIPDILNVNFNGSYLFFTHKPFAENGIAYVPIKSLASAYGFKFSSDNGVYTLTKEDKLMIVDGIKGSAEYNGKLSSNIAIMRDGVVYVSAVGFAGLMGDTAVYDKDVVITGKE